MPLCLLAFLPLGASAQQVKVTVSNPSDFQREQLVELSLRQVQQKLGIHQAVVCVKNAFGQVVPSQVTHDGKLLFEAAVRPHGSLTFTLEEGNTEVSEIYACGRVVNTRKDDLAWENDRGSYRVYGPPLRAAGEKAYGVDVWTKCTPQPVNELRFSTDYYGNIAKDTLARQGRKAEWKEMDLETSFHFDHGDGLDAYAVGPSLGCGAPALFLKGELLMPWCYESVRILDNGPLRFAVELVFGMAPVPEGLKSESSGLEALKQHRVISLDKGSNFNRCEVWYESVPAGAQLAAGVVVHRADTTSLVVNADQVLYADPTDRPQQLGSQLYVGVLFPEKCSRSVFLRAPQGDIAGNAVGLSPYAAGRHVTYFFGSAWSSYDVRSFREWQVRADEQLQALRNPLRVSWN